MRILQLLLFLCFSQFSFAQLTPWINEVDYEPGVTATNANSGMGIAGPSGLDLSAYRIDFYDAAGVTPPTIPGTVDGTQPLGVTIPASASERNEIWVDVSQNLNTSDPATGIFAVLTTSSGVVVDVVRFGGGTVNQLGALPVSIAGVPINGGSLQLTGTGCDAADFTVWDNDEAPTPDAINTGQTISAGCQALVLPVELLDFSGRSERSEHVLQWSTTAEWNNDHFTLETSTDGRTFTTLATVPARNEAATYEFRHAEPQRGGVHYYRLSQTDYDGRTEQLGTITLRSNTTSAAQLAPNPVRGSLTLKTDVPPQRIELLDLNGRFLETLPTNTLTFDASGLKAGWYALRVVDARGKVQHLRFLKQ